MADLCITYLRKLSSLVEYKTLAPGLMRGLQKNIGKSELPFGQMQLTDLFSADDLFKFDSSSDEEDAESEIKVPQITATKPNSDEDAIEELTQV